MVRVERTGQAPLEFEGELLAEAKGAWHAGNERNRWHDVAVWRTEGGAYVVSVVYRTRWQGETDVAWAETTREPGNLEVLLRTAEADVVDGAVLGFPVGDAYAEKQARLLQDLRQRLAARIGEVLAAIPEAAEHVD